MDLYYYWEQTQASDGLTGNATAACENYSMCRLQSSWQGHLPFNLRSLSDPSAHSYFSDLQY